MSIYNLDTKNDCKARFDTLQVDDIYQLNRDTNIYERVGHSDGPEPITELPYYLHSNSISIQNDTISNTVMDSNSFDVVDQVNTKSSSLLADKLVLGDINGNSELTKSKIDLIDELNGINDAADTPTSNTNFPVIYNTTTKKFKKATGLRVGTNANHILMSNNAEITAGNLNNRSVVSTTGVSVLFNNEIWTSLYYGHLKLYKRTGDFNRIYLDTNEIKLGHSTDASGINFDVTKDNINITKNDISLYDAALNTTSTIDINSFLTLNKLRDLNVDILNNDTKMVLFNPNTKNYTYFGIAPQWASAEDLRIRSYLATPTSNTKLITHDSSTNQINYIDIPTSVDVPSYLKTRSIEIQAPDSASEAIMLAANGNQSQITVKNLSPNTNYASLNANGLDIKPVIGAAISLNWDGIAYLNKHRNNLHQKKLTGPYNFPPINDARDGIVTGDGATGVTTFNMANQDEVYIYTNGGDYIRYKRWYAIKIGDSSPLPNSLVELSIIEHYNGNYEANNLASIHMSRLPADITSPFTVQAGCILFKIGNPGAGITTDTYFKGVIRIKMLNRDYTSMNNL